MSLDALPLSPSSAPQHHTDAVDRLLTSLEQLVRRHRALAADGRDVALHAELVAAEIAHELALTRSDLHRRSRAR